MTLTFCEYKLFVRDLHNNNKLLPFLVFKSFIGNFLLFAVTMMANITISFIERVCGFPMTSYEKLLFCLPFCFSWAIPYHCSKRIDS